jgi:trans-2-enoyl-CoA reductase
LIPALWSSSTLRRRAQRPSSGTRRRRSRPLSSRTLRRAALARKLREDVFSPEKHREAVEALDEDWETLDKPEDPNDQNKS